MGDQDLVNLASQLGVITNDMIGVDGITPDVLKSLIRKQELGT